MAIIAILAGMLLPALNRARNTAHNISCLNNLKQFGTAFNLYADNYNDWCISRICYGKTPGGGTRNYWFREFNNNYGIGKKMFRCPREKVFEFDQQDLNYGINSRTFGGFSPVESIRSVKRTQIIKAKNGKLDKLLVFADTVPVNLHVNRNSESIIFHADYDIPAGSLFGSRETPYMRHDKAFNSLRFDGHAEKVTATEYCGNNADGKNKRINFFSPGFNSEGIFTE